MRARPRQGPPQQFARFSSSQRSRPDKQSGVAYRNETNRNSRSRLLLGDVAGYQTKITLSDTLMSKPGARGRQAAARPEQETAQKSRRIYALSLFAKGSRA